MPMSLVAIVGAALAFGVGAAHSYLGERYVLTRLFRRPDLPPLFGSDVFTRRTLRLAWHATTLAWWGLGAVLVLLPTGASTAAIGAAVSATFGATAVLMFVGSRGRHLAWIAFLAIAAAAWYSAF